MMTHEVCLGGAEDWDYPGVLRQIRVDKNVDAKVCVENLWSQEILIIVFKIFVLPI